MMQTASFAFKVSRSLARSNLVSFLARFSKNVTEYSSYVQGRRTIFYDSDNSGGKHSIWPHETSDLESEAIEIAVYSEE